MTTWEPFDQSNPPRAGTVADFRYANGNVLRGISITRQTELSLRNWTNYPGSIGNLVAIRRSPQTAATQGKMGE